MKQEKKKKHSMIHVFTSFLIFHAVLHFVNMYCVLEEKKKSKRSCLNGVTRKDRAKETLEDDRSRSC